MNPADCRQQRELRGYWEFCTNLPAFPPAVVKKGQAGGEVPLLPTAVCLCLEFHHALSYITVFSSADGCWGGERTWSLLREVIGAVVGCRTPLGGRQGLW